MKNMMYSSSTIPIFVLLAAFLSSALIKNNNAFPVVITPLRLGILSKPHKRVYGYFLPSSEYLRSQAISSLRLHLDLNVFNTPSNRNRFLFVITFKAASLAITTYLIWKLLNSLLNTIIKGYLKSSDKAIVSASETVKQIKTTKKTSIPDSTIFEVESNTDSRKVFSYFNETYIRPGNQKDIIGIGLSQNSKVSIQEDLNEKRVTFEQMLQRAKTKLKLSWTPHAMIQGPQTSNITATALLTPVPIKTNLGPPISIAPENAKGSELSTEKMDKSFEDQPVEVDSIIDAVFVADTREEAEEDPVVTSEILSQEVEIIPYVVEVVEVVEDRVAVEVTTPSYEAVYSEVAEDTEVISNYEPEDIISSANTVHSTELMSLATSKRLKEAEILEDIGAASALLTALIISCFLGPKVGIALVATSGLLKKKADTDIAGGSKTVMQLFGRAIFESAKLLLNALNGGGSSVTTANEPPAEEDTNAKFVGQESSETDTTQNGVTVDV